MPLFTVKNEVALLENRFQLKWVLVSFALLTCSRSVPFSIEQKDRLGPGEPGGRWAAGGKRNKKKKGFLFRH